MNLRDELERLQQQHETLSRTIATIDDEMDRAGRALLNGEGAGRLLDFLQERQNAQLGFMYELGKLDAQTERLELLAREEQEQAEERLLTEQLQQASPTREDHLDWFKQDLIENPPQVDERDLTEQRMLQDMEREPSTEDHLDWFREER